MAPPPPTETRSHRSGEWDTLREGIDHAVKEAVKKALEGDSGLLRGADSEDEHREEIRRLVKEMRAAMLSNAGDLRQTLLDSVSANNTELRSMVREEVSTLRSQITNLDLSVKEVRSEMSAMKTALYQGDTQFAVLGERLSTLKEDVDRVRNTGSTPPVSITAATASLQHGLQAINLPSDYVPRRREVSTDRVARRSSSDADEKPLISNKVWNAIIIAILSAVGTGVGTYLIDWTARGAKETIKDARHHEGGANTSLPPPAVPPKAAP